MLANTQRELTIMFLHAETLAQSRSATYSEMGSAEHLFALINLCELIERHKKFILKRAQSGRYTKNRRFRNAVLRSQTRNSVAALSSQNVIGRDRPASAIGV